MRFIPELANFVDKMGEIYTVRKYRYAVGDKIYIPGVDGFFTREFIKMVTCKEDLKPFVGKSGFDTVDAWWEKILYFIPLAADKYMYHVIKVQ